HDLHPVPRRPEPPRRRDERLGRHRARRERAAAHAAAPRRVARAPRRRSGCGGRDGAVPSVSVNPVPGGTLVVRVALVTLVLLAIAIPTIQIIFATQSQAAPPRALAVQVRGWQWWWEFRYPDLDVVTANELHLPVGRTIVINLEGPDVIHSFWVPHLGGKRDVVPGRHNRIVLTPDRPGEHWGQCAEFCGASHANMGMRVIVQPAAEFDAWVARQKAAPAEPSGLAAEGKAIFAKSACVGCHTIEGVSAGMLGPNLTHFGGRTMLAAGMWPNTPDNVAAWVREPQRLKPGAKMPELGLTDAQANAVAAYLTGLK